MKPFHTLIVTITLVLSTISFNTHADRAYVSIGGGSALDYVFTYRTGKKGGSDVKALKIDKGVFKGAASVALGGEGSWWRSAMRLNKYSSDLISNSAVFQFDYMMRSNDNLALFAGPNIGIYTISTSNDQVKKNPWLYGFSLGSTFYFSKKTAVSLRFDSNFSTFLQKYKVVDATAGDDYTGKPIVSTQSVLLTLDFLI